MASLQKPCVVLVADDNADVADSLASFLSLSGFRCEVSYDGQQALQRFEQLEPDVALLDIGMPCMTGYEVAKEIRKRGNRALLIAITGWGTPEDVTTALECGFDIHMTKPADPAKILRAIGERRGGGTEAGPA